MQTINLPIDKPDAALSLHTEDRASCEDPQPRDPIAHPGRKPRPVFARTFVAHEILTIEEEE